ncbi:MFS transporter [Leptospira selangorensis]|uniref:MFS transporter n=1 Tax=Leptospira selangorensis TaxID=2484982 RepID=A0A5F2C3D3_9LEPT|nr:MFS transporter [Leptospira selangorensis]TGM15637.1 MFS transporter [Leptospira selangorensis]TGM18413.1 MFS transporter [Leptospira selangorensis]
MSKRFSFHYAWIVLIVTFFTLIVAAGVRSMPGILIVPLEKEFGWNRSAISFAVSVNLLLYGLVGPFAAGLMNRFGIKRIMVFALGLLISGILLTTIMRTNWELVVLWGVMVGFGSGMAALVLGATVVNRWFVSHRGLLMGILTASTATGQIIFLPFLASLTEQEGWRNAVYAVASILGILLPTVFFLMKDSPKQSGLLPYGAKSEEEGILPVSGNPFMEAISALRVGLRSRNFWLLAGSFFVCGASTNGLVGTHLVPACSDHGIPEVRAAGLLALMGIFDLIGTVGSGWLSDRVNNKILLFMYYGLRGISLLLLPQAFDPESNKLSIFAVFYGLDWIATVPPTVALTAKIFGREKVGLMFGWVVAFHQIGAAVAAFGAGYIRTVQGEYDLAFMFAGALCVITALGIFAVSTEKEEGKLSETPEFAS